MEITDKLTTDYMTMHINIPTDKGTEHYAVEIERRNTDEDIYSVEILDLDNLDQILYSHFEIDSEYGMFDDRKLDECEEAILLFIANRLRLD